MKQKTNTPKKKRVKNAHNNNTHTHTHAQIVTGLDGTLFKKNKQQQQTKTNNNNNNNNIRSSRGAKYTIVVTQHILFTVIWRQAHGKGPLK